MFLRKKEVGPTEIAAYSPHLLLPHGRRRRAAIKKPVSPAKEKPAKKRRDEEHFGLCKRRARFFNGSFFPQKTN
jgi:hypothetical protein